MVILLLDFILLIILLILLILVINLIPCVVIPVSCYSSPCRHPALTISWPAHVGRACRTPAGLERRRLPLQGWPPEVNDADDASLPADGLRRGAERRVMLVA